MVIQNSLNSPCSQKFMLGVKKFKVKADTTVFQQSQTLVKFKKGNQRVLYGGTGGVGSFHKGIFFCQDERNSNSWYYFFNDYEGNAGAGLGLGDTLLSFQPSNALLVESSPLTWHRELLYIVFPNNLSKSGIPAWGGIDTSQNPGSSGGGTGIAGSQPSWRREENSVKIFFPDFLKIIF